MKTVIIVLVFVFAIGSISIYQLLVEDSLLNATLSTDTHEEILELVYANTSMRCTYGYTYTLDTGEDTTVSGIMVYSNGKTKSVDTHTRSEEDAFTISKIDNGSAIYTWINDQEIGNVERRPMHTKEESVYSKKIEQLVLGSSVDTITCRRWIPRKSVFIPPNHFSSADAFPIK